MADGASSGSSGSSLLETRLQRMRQGPQVTRNRPQTESAPGHSFGRASLGGGVAGISILEKPPSQAIAARAKFNPFADPEPETKSYGASSSSYRRESSSTAGGRYRPEAPKLEEVHLSSDLMRVREMLKGRGFSSVSSTLPQTTVASSRRESLLKRQPAAATSLAIVGEVLQPPAPPTTGGFFSSSSSNGRLNGSDYRDRSSLFSTDRIPEERSSMFSYCSPPLSPTIPTSPVGSFTGSDYSQSHREEIESKFEAFGAKMDSSSLSALDRINRARKVLEASKKASESLKAESEKIKSKISERTSAINGAREDVTSPTSVTSGPSQYSRSSSVVSNDDVAASIPRYERTLPTSTNYSTGSDFPSPVSHRSVSNDSVLNHSESSHFKPVETPYSSRIREILARAKGTVPSEETISHQTDSRLSPPTFDSRSAQPNLDSRSSPPTFQSRSSPPTFQSRSSPPTFQSSSSPPAFQSTSSASRYSRPSFQPRPSSPAFPARSPSPTFETIAPHPSRVSPPLPHTLPRQNKSPKKDKVEKQNETASSSSKDVPVSKPVRKSGFDRPTKSTAAKAVPEVKPKPAKTTVKKSKKLPQIAMFENMGHQNKTEEKPLKKGTRAKPVDQNPEKTMQKMLFGNNSDITEPVDVSDAASEDARSMDSAELVSLRQAASSIAKNGYEKNRRASKSGSASPRCKTPRNDRQSPHPKSSRSSSSDKSGQFSPRTRRKSVANGSPSKSQSRKNSPDGSGSRSRRSSVSEQSGASLARRNSIRSQSGVRVQDKVTLSSMNKMVAKSKPDLRDIPGPKEDKPARPVFRRSKSVGKETPDPPKTNARKNSTSTSTSPSKETKTTSSQKSTSSSGRKTPISSQSRANMQRSKSEPPSPTKSSPENGTPSKSGQPVGGWEFIYVGPTERKSEEVKRFVDISREQRGATLEDDDPDMVRIGPGAIRSVLDKFKKPGASENGQDSVINGESYDTKVSERVAMIKKRILGEQAFFDKGHADEGEVSEMGGAPIYHPSTFRLNMGEVIHPKVQVDDTDEPLYSSRSIDSESTDYDSAVEALSSNTRSLISTEDDSTSEYNSAAETLGTDSDYETVERGRLHTLVKKDMLLESSTILNKEELTIIVDSNLNSEAASSELTPKPIDVDNDQEQNDLIAFDEETHLAPSTPLSMPSGSDVDELLFSFDPVAVDTPVVSCSIYENSSDTDCSNIHVVNGHALSGETQINYNHIANSDDQIPSLVDLSVEVEPQTSLPLSYLEDNQCYDNLAFGCEDDSEIMDITLTAENAGLMTAGLENNQTAAVLVRVNNPSTDSEAFKTPELQCSENDADFVKNDSAEPIHFDLTEQMISVDVTENSNDLKTEYNSEKEDKNFDQKTGNKNINPEDKIQTSDQDNNTIELGSTDNVNNNCPNDTNSKLHQEIVSSQLTEKSFTSVPNEGLSQDADSVFLDETLNKAAISDKTVDKNSFTSVPSESSLYSVESSESFQEGSRLQSESEITDASEVKEMLEESSGASVTSPTQSGQSSTNKKRRRSESKKRRRKKKAETAAALREAAGTSQNATTPEESSEHPKRSNSGKKSSRKAKGALLVTNLLVMDMGLGLTTEYNTEPGAVFLPSMNKRSASEESLCEETGSVADDEREESVLNTHNHSFSTDTDEQRFFTPEAVSPQEEIPQPGFVKNNPFVLKDGIVAHFRDEDTDNELAVNNNDQTICAMFKRTLGLLSVKYKDGSSGEEAVASLQSHTPARPLKKISVSESSQDELLVLAPRGRSSTNESQPSYPDTSNDNYSEAESFKSFTEDNHVSPKYLRSQGHSFVLHNKFIQEDLKVKETRTPPGKVLGRRRHFSSGSKASAKVPPKERALSEDDLDSYVIIPSRESSPFRSPESSVEKGSEKPKINMRFVKDNPFIKSDARHKQRSKQDLYYDDGEILDDQSSKETKKHTHEGGSFGHFLKASFRKLKHKPFKKAKSKTSVSTHDLSGNGKDSCVESQARSIQTRFGRSTPNLIESVNSSVTSESLLHHQGNADESELVQSRIHMKSWDPTKLLQTLYSVKLMNETVEDLSHRFISMEGIMEKLPQGKRKSTLLKTWKRRYFKAADGWLHYFENNNYDNPSHSIQLMGGTVEVLDTRIIGIDDGRGHYLMVRCPNVNDFENWRVALESQTTDNAKAVYVRPVPQSPPHPNKRVVIIDIGSCSVRAGVLGEQVGLPELFFPTVVAKNKTSGECVVGFDAFRPEIREQSTLHFPVRPSIKVDKGKTKPFNIDMDLLPVIFDKIFKDLKIDSKMYWVLLSTPQMLAAKLKAEIMHTLTKRSGVAGVCIAPQSLLAMYSYKATSGIIVDVGERIEILPISDGYIVDGGVTRQPFGGEKVLDSLNHSLMQKRYHFFTEVERLIVRHIMEQSCYIAPNYVEEGKKFNSDPKSFLASVDLREFDLPENTCREVTHDEGRFRSAEGFFNTDLWGMDYPKLHKLVHKAIMECPMDNRREMCRSIYLSGGVTLLPGFAERLQAELTKLMPKGLTIQVHASPHRYHAAFIGGCTLAAQDLFEQTCISREQWNKNGTKELKKWHMPS